MTSLYYTYQTCSQISFTYVKQNTKATKVYPLGSHEFTQTIDQFQKRQVRNCNTTPDKQESWFPLALQQIHDWSLLALSSINPLLKGLRFCPQNSPKSVNHFYFVKSKMKWAFLLVLIAANSSNGGFIPFKRVRPSESPDVGRNVVSDLLSIGFYIALDQSFVCGINGVFIVCGTIPS